MSITNPNLGPLTTAYSASGNNCDSIFRTNNGVLVRGTTTDSVSWCLPTNYLPRNGYYYSPGICPSGYTYACFAGLGDGGTAATCCPTSYNCKISRATTDNAACSSRFDTDSSFTISQYICTDGDTISKLTTVFYAAGNIVFASGVVVRRADDDPTWLITGSTTLNTHTQSSDTPTPTGLESGGPASIGLGNISVDSGLTTSAKIGIGVGVSFGILFIIGSIIAAYGIGKRKRRLLEEGSNQSHVHFGDEYQIYNEQGSANQCKDMGQAELEEQRRRAELDGRRSPVELTG